jgi:GH25 family lysozyme M1 (1,4-beta-N-acetylmuramidase)
MNWLTGIDISHYQGNIAWKKVADAKIDFAYIRSNVGTTKDNLFEVNAKRATRNKIPFGFYVYVKPELDSEKQVEMILKAHRECGATLVPQVDVEHHGDLHPRYVRRSVNIITSAITQELGKEPVIYTGQWFWDSRVKTRKFRKYPLWVAKYVKYSDRGYRACPVPLDPQYWDEYALSFETPAPFGGWYDWDIWQFSAGFNGVGKKYGMQSNDLDLNIMKKRSWSKFLI